MCVCEHVEVCISGHTCVLAGDGTTGARGGVQRATGYVSLELKIKILINLFVCLYLFF